MQNKHAHGKSAEEGGVADLERRQEEPKESRFPMNDINKEKRKEESKNHPSMKQKHNPSQLNYEIHEDLDTNQWNVHPVGYAFDGGDEWMVECKSRNEASAFRKALLEGRVSSPTESPEDYSEPRKHSNGRTMIYSMKHR